MDYMGLIGIYRVEGYSRIQWRIRLKITRKAWLGSLWQPLVWVGPPSGAVVLVVLPAPRVCGFGGFLSPPVVPVVCKE